MSGGNTSTIVAGDIHGDASRLERLLREFDRPDDRIILVGDYVNRGPDSRHVLEILQQEKSRRGYGLQLLRGNHEEALLEFLAGGSIEDFARHGGLATIKSYVPKVTGDIESEFRNIFPMEHLELIQDTALSYEDSEVFISHAGFCVDEPHARNSPTLTRGDPRIFQYDGPWPRETVVIGHYVQRSGRPMITDHLLAIDTGCGTLAGNPLTAVRLADRRVFQF